MSVIQANKGVVTPADQRVLLHGSENQQALIELLKEAAEFASGVPGWISANIHRSLDGTRVVN